MAPYNFRMRAICVVFDMRTFLRLMLMAHSSLRLTPAVFTLAGPFQHKQTHKLAKQAPPAPSPRTLAIRLLPSESFQPTADRKSKLGRPRPNRTRPDPSA